MPELMLAINWGLTFVFGSLTSVLSCDNKLLFCGGSRVRNSMMIAWLIVSICVVVTIRFVVKLLFPLKRYFPIFILLFEKFIIVSKSLRMLESEGKIKNLSDFFLRIGFKIAFHLLFVITALPQFRLSIYPLFFRILLLVLQLRFLKDR